MIIIKYININSKYSYYNLYTGVESKLFIGPMDFKYVSNTKYPLTLDELEQRLKLNDCIIIYGNEEYNNFKIKNAEKFI